MKMKFKANAEPYIEYEVKNPTPVMEYSKLLKKETPCIELSVLGLVPQELLEECNSAENIQAIDVLVALKNK